MTNTDPAGNTSNPTDKPFTDTTAPNAPTVSVTDSGNGDGGITVSGTGEPNSSITVTFPDGSSGTTTTDGNGDYSIDSPPNQPSGTVSVTNTDPAGNTSIPTNESFTDSTAPNIAITTVPTDVINKAESDNISISGTVSGAEDGQTITVTITDSAGTTVTATVAVSGNTWAVSSVNVSTLTDGELSITAKVEDQAGNLANTSVEKATKDTEASITITEPIAGDNVMTAQESQGLAVSGTVSGVEDGQTITVTITDSAGNTVTAQTTVSGSSWTVSGIDASSLTDGSVNIEVSVTDQANNTADAAQAADKDSTAPNIAIDAPVAGDGLICGSEQAALSITGTTDAETGQTVNIIIADSSGSSVAVSAIVNAGVWGVSGVDVSSLANGELTITAEVSNKAGHSSSDSKTADKEPSVAIDSLANDSGTAGDWITNDLDPLIGGHIDGTLGSGQKVQLSLDGGSTWVDLALSSDASMWTYQLPAVSSDTTYSLVARIVKDDGSIGATDSKTLEINVTTIPIATPTIDAITDNVGAATGNVSSGGITDDTTPSLSGSLSASLAADETLYIYRSYTNSSGNTISMLAGTATVNGTSWIFDDSGLVDGISYTYTAKVVNNVGNSTVSAGYTIIEHAPPLIQTVALEAATDSGVVGDWITNARGFNLDIGLSKALQGSEEVIITIGSNTYTPTSSSGTSYSFVIPETDVSADGDYPVTVNVLDSSGNVVDTQAVTVTIDRTPPAAPTINPNNGINDITGTGEAGSTIIVTFPDGSSATTVVSEGGQWTMPSPGGLANGDTITAKAADEAGNTSTDATTQVDRISPAEITGIALTPASDSGIQGDYITNLTPELYVYAPQGMTADETLQISLDNGASWINLLQGQQVFGEGRVYSDIRLLPDGDYTYLARIVDAAGNAGPVTSQIITIDKNNSLTIDTNGTSLSGTTDKNATVVVTQSDGNTVTTTADSNGNWSFANNPIAAGTTANITATDAAGNAAAAQAQSNAPVPQVKITTPIMGDDMIDGKEKAKVVVSGTVTNIADGQTVNVTFTSSPDANGATKTVTAAGTVSGGKWSITSDLTSMDNGCTTIKATVNDSASGITVNDTASVNYVGHPIDVAIQIDVGGNDNVITPSDLQAGKLPISGIYRYMHACDTIDLYAEFTDGTGTVQRIKIGSTVVDGKLDSNGTGTWSMVADIDTSIIPDGSVLLIAVGTNIAGTESSLTGEALHTVQLDLDANIEPSLKLDTSTTQLADDIVDGTEYRQVYVKGDAFGIPGGTNLMFVITDKDGNQHTTSTVINNGKFNSSITFEGLSEGPVDIQLIAKWDQYKWNPITNQNDVTHKTVDFTHTVIYDQSYVKPAGFSVGFNEDGLLGADNQQEAINPSSENSTNAIAKSAVKFAADLASLHGLLEDNSNDIESVLAANGNIQANADFVGTSLNDMVGSAYSQTLGTQNHLDELLNNVQQLIV